MLPPPSEGWSDDFWARRLKHLAVARGDQGQLLPLVSGRLSGPHPCVLYLDVSPFIDSIKLAP